MSSEALITNQTDLLKHLKRLKIITAIATILVIVFVSIAIALAVRDNSNTQEQASCSSVPSPNSTEVSTSYWLKDAPWQGSMEGSLPTSANVVVIGGGITGLSTLYWLQQYEVNDLVLLEARGISSGATGRNGGHINPGVYAPSQDQIDQYGEEEMRNLFLFKVNCTNLLLDFIRQNSLDEILEFRLTGSLGLANTPEEAAAYQQLVAQLQTEGPNPGNVSYLNAAEVTARIFSDPSVFSGGILIQNAGRLWPAKLVWTLANITSQRGANIQPNTRVKQVITDTNNKKIIITERGKIEANYVIYATNAYTSQLFPQLTDIVPITPVRGQVIATGTVRETLNVPYTMGMNDDKTGDYFIQRDDGTIVFGGFRWQGTNQDVGVSSDISKNTVIANSLRNYLTNTFPALRQNFPLSVQAEWTGIMGFTPDYLPLIGPLPTPENLNTDSPQEFIAAGYSGNGMPWGFGMGQTISQLLTKQLNFSTFHPPLRSDRFLNQTYAAKHRECRSGCR